MALWGIYGCNYFEIGLVVQEKMVFKRWHYGEYMGVIILKLDQWYRKRWCLKDGIMGTIYVCSYFEIGSVVQEKMVFKRWHYGDYICV